MWCIYRIVNKVNGHSYIGQHLYHTEDRMMYKGNHIYRGSGKLIRQAYKDFGGYNNFETEILYSRIQRQDTADSLERLCIERYKPEYNIAKGGQFHKRAYYEPWNKGKKGRPYEITEELHETLSKKQSKQNSVQNVGRRWFNNGEINVFRYECPEGFTEGMIKGKQHWKWTDEARKNFSERLRNKKC